MRWVVIALIAFGVGHLLGFAIRPEATPVRAEREHVVLEASAPAPPPAEAEAVRGPFATLTDALDAIPMPPPPTGEFALSGEVREAAGEPVPGVLVDCEPSVEEDPDGDLVERVRARATRVRWARDAIRVARTDAEGRYRIDGLAAIPHRVRARLDHFTFHAKGGTPVTPDARLDFLATAQSYCDVEVLLPDGSRPEKASIFARGRARGHLTHGRNGWYAERQRNGLWLQPGRWTLWAEVDGVPGFVSDAVEIVVRRGEPIEPLTFRLRPRAGVHGTVEFEGEPLGMARVAVRRRSGSEEPDPESFRATGATSVREGAYDLLGLEPGKYWIALLLGSAPPVEIRAIDVGSDPQRVDFRIDGDSERFFPLRTFDGEGKPLDGVRIEGGFGFDMFWIRMGPGDLRLPQRLRGPFSLACSHEDEGQRFVEANSPVHEPIEVRFERRYDLKVKIRGFRPTKDVQLVCTVVSTEADEEGRLRLGGNKQPVAEDGSCTLRVREGAWDIVVHPQTRSGTAGVVARGAVQLPGQESVTIEVPTLHAVELVFAAGVTEFLLQADDDGPDRFYSRVWSPQRRQRRHTLHGIPAGEYRIELEEKRSKAFTVPAKGPVELEFE